MEGFANASDIPFLVVSALVVALVTAIAALVANRLMPNRGRAAVAMVAAAVVPGLLLGVAFAQSYLMPAPDSPDAQAMLFGALLYMALFSLAVSALTAVTVVALRR